MVVTDMTAIRRNEEMLRALSHRQVQAQEAERARVALELHDRITQLLCAILVRSQTLAKQTFARDASAKERRSNSATCSARSPEKWSVSRAICGPASWTSWVWSPSCATPAQEFTKRTGVSVKLASVRLTARLPADTELTLYRILQEALKNVEKHARARHVTVQPAAAGRLRSFDDQGRRDRLRSGCTRLAKRKGKGGLDLLSMRERAAYMGGALKVKSVRGAGTEIKASIPLSSITVAAD